MSIASQYGNCYWNASGESFLTKKCKIFLYKKNKIYEN